MRTVSLAATLLGLGALRVAMADTPQPKPALQFPAETSMVMVDAVVLDRDGRPVEGLRSEDFVVEEEGAPQAVVSFQAVEARIAATESEEDLPLVSTNVVRREQPGRTFAIVFDNAHLTPVGAIRAKAAVARFLSTSVHDGDAVSLISTTGGAWWTTHGTRECDRLIDLLEGLSGARIDMLPPNVYVSDAEASRIVEQDDKVTAGAVYQRLITAGVTFNPDVLAAALATSSVPTTTGSTPSPPVSRDMQEWERFHPEVHQYASQVYQALQVRRHVVLQTLERVLESLATRGGRKSLLLVSEGFVADLQTPGYREVIGAARRANTAVYFLDARGLIVGGENLMEGAGQVTGRDGYETAMLALARSDLAMESAGSEELAIETGGFSVKNANDLTKGLRAIERESATYYLLGYHSSDGRRDGRYRSIRVRVQRPGVTVRARRGYFAPSDAPRREPQQEGQAARADREVRPLLQQAVDSPFEMESVPLRVSSYALEAKNRYQANVVVVAEVDIRGLGFQRLNDRYLDRLLLVAVMLDLASGKRTSLNETIDMRLTEQSHEAHSRSWYPVLRNFELGSGRHQVRIVVLDENSRAIGSVTHEFEVPDLTGWRVSTPVLSDTLEAAEKGSVPRPVPRAQREFRASGVLYCMFAVYGAATDAGSGRADVASGFSLQMADGRQILRGDEATIRPDSRGNLVRLMGVPLDGLVPGDYALVLSFQDRVAGVRHSQREVFSVRAD
jgi:VWFA-related protein